MSPCVNCPCSNHEHATIEEVEAARLDYQNDDCEIDNAALVSRTDEGGVWVQAWVWVPTESEDD